MGGIICSTVLLQKPSLSVFSIKFWNKRKSLCNKTYNNEKNRCKAANTGKKIKKHKEGKWIYGKKTEYSIQCK